MALATEEKQQKMNQRGKGAMLAEREMPASQ